MSDDLLGPPALKRSTTVVFETPPLKRGKVQGQPVRKNIPSDRRVYDLTGTESTRSVDSHSGDESFIVTSDGTPSEEESSAFASPVETPSGTSSSSYSRKSGPYSSYCYTKNNPDLPNDFEALRDLPGMTYHVCTIEKAPTTGTVHLQGCFTSAKPMRVEQARKLIGGAHVEPARHLAQAREYCLKDATEGNHFIVDNRKQGSRTDLQEACAVAVATLSIRKVAEAFPTTYVKFNSGLSSLIALQHVPRGNGCAPTVHYFYGGTGTGKTAVAHHIAQKYYGGSIWTSDGDLTRLNGYENQRVVLFDDFRMTEAMLPLVLRMTDRYPITVNVKYGYREWQPEVIIFTAPFAPEHSVAGLTNEDMGQFSRRITNIVEFLPLKTSESWDIVEMANYKLVKGMIQF